ncbi:hypothetical protein LFL96_25790 [Paraburkholderia sp. D15]|uniref:hypothetical protein n=1 Tax=Paraburkholderia sp. D15 TaxID=2880218 RepID=UPI00247B1178|nr:hypothetical protein [Paraburkholderia sp. D15]WGS54428.1 hypothetical protein LFL96_25790 [Paraburkholderia sp. D15]
MPAKPLKERIIEEAFKYFLPVILKRLHRLFNWLWEQLQGLIARFTSRRTKEAAHKAEEASRKAAESTDPLEKARQQGREEAFREMAASYERDIAQLKAEIDHLREEMQAKSSDELTRMSNRSKQNLLEGPAQSKS